MSHGSGRANALMGLACSLAALVLAGGPARAESPAEPRTGPSTSRRIHETTVVTAIDRGTL